MGSSGSVRGKEVARIEAAELEEPWAPVRFDFEDPMGRSVEGVAMRVDGEVIAFENICPHLGMPLDCHGGDFRAVDGVSLVCDAHGARFAAEDGECSVGPCEGDRLSMMRVRRAEEEGDEAYVVLRGRSLSM